MVEYEPDRSEPETEESILLSTKPTPRGALLKEAERAPDRAEGCQRR